MTKPSIIARQMGKPARELQSLQAGKRLSTEPIRPRANLPRGVAEKSLQCLTGDTLGRPAFVAQASEMVLCGARRTAQPQEPPGGENTQRRQPPSRRPPPPAPHPPRP